MRERCTEWGNKVYTVFRICLLAALFASVILSIHTDRKKRELNQRHETLIEQEEEAYKYMIKIIEELKKHVERKKKESPNFES